ncbi:MAG: potassium transporter TrkA [Haloarculaceae archaeon]
MSPIPVSPVAATPWRTVGGLALQSLTERATDGAATVLGLVLLAAVLAGAVALVYRWYTRERLSAGLPVLVGLSGVALYLGTSRALSQLIGNTGDPLDEATALFNIVTFLVGALAARAGAGVGDRVANDVFVATGGRDVEGDVGRVVQAVGRVLTVELPEEIEDLVGYDPVADETKTKLAGKTFLFPRRLTVGELRDRLVTRLKADYAVGHVDVELADDGTVEYLAVGSRAAGIGPTLPPETSAVAVRADPALAASAGDVVQVWRTDPAERVLTAELRGTVGDVATLAVDAADTRKLADDETYKLVTLPVETRPEREFASLLRAAAETMATVTVGADSALAGQPVGALDASVVAVHPADGPVEPLPGRDRRIAPGDGLYVVATPEAIRKIEQGARPGADRTASAGSTMPADRRIDPTTPIADEQESPTDRASERTESDRTPASDGPGTVDASATATDRTPRQTDDEAVDAGRSEPASGGSAAPTEEPDGREGGPDGPASTGPDGRDDPEFSGEEPPTGDESATDEEAEGDEKPAADESDDPFDLGEPDLSDLGSGVEGTGGPPDAGEAGVEEIAGDDDPDASTGSATVDGSETATGSDETAEGDASNGTAGNDAPAADKLGPKSTGDGKADEPTRDDLADLPGTDPGDLLGTGVDGPSDIGSGPGDETGDAADGKDGTDSESEGNGDDDERASGGGDDESASVDDGERGADQRD